MAQSQERILDATQLVDDYVLACAMAADAEARKAAAAKAIIASGMTHLTGTLNKVSVSRVQGRVTVNTKQMVEDGVLLPEQLEAYSKRGDPYDRINVSALT